MSILRSVPLAFLRIRANRATTSASARCTATRSWPASSSGVGMAHRAEWQTRSLLCTHAEISALPTPCTTKPASFCRGAPRTRRRRARFARPQKKQVARIEELLKSGRNSAAAVLPRTSPLLDASVGFRHSFPGEGVSKRANLAIQIETTIADQAAAPIEIVLYSHCPGSVDQRRQTLAGHPSRFSHQRENRIVCCSIEDNGVGFARKAAPI